MKEKKKIFVFIFLLDNNLVQISLTYQTLKTTHIGTKIHVTRTKDE